MARGYTTLGAMAAYVAGGGLLAVTGPAIWDVPPYVAALAASATTLVFAAAHIIADTRHVARQAMAEAKRLRRELVALGRYVAKLEPQLAVEANAVAAEPEARTFAPVPPMPEPELVAEVVRDHDVAGNLLQFAQRVAAHCSTGEGADEETGDDSAHEDAAAGPQTAVAEAIAAARMELHLRPIARLAGGQTAHFRAIARLQRADGTLIPQAEVDDGLAAAALAAEYETQQLAAVISLCNRIGDRHSGARIFCALSGEALKSDAFRAEMTGFMESHPELARRLVFEMDLATVLALNAEAVGDLRALEDIGFAFAVAGGTMQDLGRAFNAFGRLAYARIEARKLGGVDPNIVRALAKAGTQLIATGVEADEVAAELAEAGVDFAEGALFGGPRRAKMADTPQRLAA